jgi:hypothetical protein
MLPQGVSGIRRQFEKGILLKFAGTVFFFLIVAASVGHTEPLIPQPIVFELYSWQQGKEWRYSLWEGTTTVRSPETVRARKNQLPNTTFLKGRIAALPTGGRVYWRENRSAGFSLPSQELTKEIREFAEGSQVKILLPEDLPKK